MEKDYDIIIIGGGPAGLSTALSLSKSNLKILLVEKKPSIGTHIQCGESISKYLMPYLPFDLPKDCFLKEMKGVLFSTSDYKIKREGEYWEGWNIDREYLEKWMKEKAKQKNVDILTSYEFESLNMDKKTGIVESIIIRHYKKTIKLKCKILIDACGVKSKIQELLGETTKKEKSFGEVVSFELENVSIKDHNYDQIYFGQFAPGGYGYIFPTSQHSCTVGVAAIDELERLEEYYHKFIKSDIHGIDFSNHKEIADKSGEIPIDYPQIGFTYNNIAFVGDSANQNIKPFVEGILPAIICGTILGDVIIKNNLEKNPFEGYADTVRDYFNDILSRSDSLIPIMKKLPFEIEVEKLDILYLGIFSEIINPGDINNVKNLSKKELVKLIDNAKI